MSAPGTELAGRGQLTPGGLALSTRGQLLDIVYLGGEEAAGAGQRVLSDARLAFDTEALEADLVLEAGDLSPERTLLTSIVLSLFTDARARDDDELPAGETSRRGWWGDLLAEPEGDRFGSRLWLLSREKTTPRTLARAREYAREALQWLIDDRIATRVDVEAEFQQLTGEATRSVLALGVAVFRPDLSRVAYRFRYVWEA